MLQDELKEIRTQLRMAMNGVISTSMREKGIDYKLNFGVPLPEIKQIAARHEPGSDLAAAFCGKRISSSLRYWHPCCNLWMIFLLNRRNSG